MEKLRVAFFGNDAERLHEVYDPARRARIAEIASLFPHVVTSASFASQASALADVQAVFSTWGMPELGPQQIAALRSLKALFYAAGSVRGFARPFLERGIRVSSAWDANAVPVAEFAFSQIVLSCKGFFRNSRQLAADRGAHGKRAFSGPGCYGETVALLGAGRVARRLIGMLSRLDLHVIVYDPYLDAAEAAGLGVEKVPLEDAFRRGYVVSNHVPNLPETVGLLNARLFRLMRADATFLNTGRGATVVEDDLIAVARERPDLSALLDVTWPEPPAPQSPLYSLANVWLSSHIAGSKGDEVRRMADAMIEEYVRWAAGGRLEHEVTLDVLERMA